MQGPVMLPVNFSNNYLWGSKKLVPDCDGGSVTLALGSYPSKQYRIRNKLDFDLFPFNVKTKYGSLYLFFDI